MAAGAIRAGSAFVEIFSDDSKLVRGLKGIESKVKRTGANIGNLGARVAGVGAAVAGIGGIGAAALSWPLQLAANMEQTEAAFTTLLKDQTKAAALLQDLQKFAASTPFQFNELADASKKLLAFGSSASQVEGELRAIGDVASGIGAPIGEIAEIYGKARVQGRLFAEDINQLTGRGIPIIQELAKQFGVADQEVKKLVQDGAISFDNLEAAFKSLTSEGGKFAGGMARQSRTLNGTFSTLKDNLIAAFRPFGEALLPAAKAALKIGTQLVQKFGEFADKNRELVIPIAAAVAAVTALGGAGVVAGTVLIGLGAAVSAIGTIAGAVGTVVAAVSAPVVGIAAGVAAIGASFVYVAQQAGLLMPAFNFLKDGFGQVFRVFKNTFGGIVNALKSGEFGLAAQIAWDGVRLASLIGAQQLLKGIDNLWNNAGSITLRFFAGLQRVTAKVFGSLKDIAWNALKGGGNIQAIMADALGDIFGGNLDLAGNLQPAIDKARARLRANVNLAARQQQPGQIAGQAAQLGQLGPQAITNQTRNIINQPGPRMAQPSRMSDRELLHEQRKQTAILMQMAREGLS
jgi:tape measure domain-containing protein